MALPSLKDSHWDFTVGKSCSYLLSRLQAISSPDGPPIGISYQGEAAAQGGLHAQAFEAFGQSIELGPFQTQSVSRIN
jgi:hypothetical protein